MSIEQKNVVEAEIHELEHAESPEGVSPSFERQRRLWIISALCIGAMALAFVGALFMIDGGQAIVIGAAMLFAYAVMGGAAAVFGVRERIIEQQDFVDRASDE